MIIIIAGSLEESEAILVLVLKPPPVFSETSILNNSEVYTPFLVCAGQDEPGFRSSILLSKLVRYAFPVI